MTIQEAYKKIKDSEELKKKAIEALKNGKADEFLKEQGFDLTMDQIKEALQAKKSENLSKEELNMVAGGDCGDEETCGDLAFSAYTFGVGCIISFATSGVHGYEIRDC